jgi:hypothetical protein
MLKNSDIPYTLSLIFENIDSIFKVLNKEMLYIHETIELADGSYYN